MGLAAVVMSLHNFSAMFTTKQSRRRVKWRQRVCLYSQPASALYLWRARLQWNFTQSGIFVLSLFSYFIFRTPSEVKLVILKEEKTFTDNICDELRKQLSNLKINPDDQISMWIHHGLRFLFVCKSSFELGRHFGAHLISRSIVMSKFWFTSHSTSGDEDAERRTTNKMFVNHDVIEKNRERRFYSALYVWKLLHVNY